MPADQSLPVGDAVGNQVADGVARVVVTGWQTYDNKGRVVEKYEPFFSTGWDYVARDQAPPGLFGQKATLYYDGPGRLVRTVNPES
jgi:hypothetical protein